MSKNNIRVVEAKVFGNSTFELLTELSENKIENLNNQSFKFLTNLTQLILVSNEIKYLDLNSFNSFRSLNFLDLSDSYLVEIRP
jgi:hypothetical protein